MLANALYRKRTDLALQAQLAEISELRARLEAENVYLRDEITSVRGFNDIVGESPLLRDVLQRVALVAPTDTAVLLRGETGTGKEPGPSSPARPGAAEPMRNRVPAPAPRSRVSCGTMSTSFCSGIRSGGATFPCHAHSLRVYSHLPTSPR